MPVQPARRSRNDANQPDAYQKKPTRLALAPGCVRTSLLLGASLLDWGVTAAPHPSACFCTPLERSRDYHSDHFFADLWPRQTY